MPKGRLTIQITVICGCGQLETYYGGGARDTNPGTLVGFMQTMMDRGWEELDGENWQCPTCVHKRTGRNVDEAQRFAERFANA